jgi:rhamnose transport system permease protein
VILGDEAVSGFTEKFAYLGQGYIGNTYFPFPLVIFLALAVILGLVLHKTVFGRMIYAMGWNENACFASGIQVNRIKLLLFALSGTISGIAGVFITSRIGNTRPNIATGFELEIITIVILGGVLISGGVGNMWGVFISIILIGTIRYGLGLNNIPGQVMLVITGSLLIGSILLNNLIKKFLNEGRPAGLHKKTRSGATIKASD